MRARASKCVTVVTFRCSIQENVEQVSRVSCVRVFHVFFPKFQPSKVTIDCARLPVTGKETDMDDDVWWLHLYVMFSRATRMSDMLLLRSPPRALLERGPPANVQIQLQRFAERAGICREGALRIARDFGLM